MTPTSGIFASVWPASFNNRPSSAPIHACGVDDVVSPINTSSDSAPIGADDDPCAQRLSRYFMSSFLTWQLYPSTGGQLLVSAEGSWVDEDSTHVGPWICHLTGCPIKDDIAVYQSLFADGVAECIPRLCFERVLCETACPC